ncbi:MAG TPA: peptidyl-alpha-hydroxyglycine alpha-amidating lyase family protein [bacterium]|nr:peptidyl-alpha-hydroxyglycine alpha-amidating lyase family protein [bacterium]
MARVGNGEYVFEVVEDWAKLPAGWTFKEVSGVGVDRQDRVHVFSRGEHPVTIFDRDGAFLASWGEGVFARPHAVTMGADDTIYLTDDGDHTVRKCTLDGKVLLTIGAPGKPAPIRSGRPFNRCTHVALAQDGSLYISDGYGNSRVHKYAPDGTLLFSWGEPGTDPGQFNLPHNLCVDREGFVYVADRENHRIQVFDPQGKFETQWNNLYRPCGLFIDQRDPDGERVYVGELGPSLPVSTGVANLGARVGIYTLRDQLLARLGDGLPGEGAGQFLAPHAIAVDSHGDLYVGEVSWTMYGRQLDPPREARSFRKFVRITPKSSHSSSGSTHSSSSGTNGRRQ